MIAGCFASRQRSRFKRLSFQVGALYLAAMEDSKVSVIIDAATSRFAHYGLSKTTMNEIAADIGMSKAALYYYFPDKERLFIAVVTKEFDQFESAVRSMIDRDSKAGFKLKRYVTIRNQFLEKLRNMAKVESANLTEMMNPVYNEMKNRLFNKEKQLVASIFAYGISNGEFRKVNINELADFFVSSLVGLRSTGLVLPAESEADHFSKSIAQSVLLTSILLEYLRTSP